MTAVVLLGLVAGLGSVGLAVGVRTRTDSLEAIAAAMNRPASRTSPTPSSRLRRVGVATAEWFEVRSSFSTAPRFEPARQCLAITTVALDRLVTRSLLVGGLGLLSPTVLWLGLAGVGVFLPVPAVVLLTLVTTPAGALLPVMVVQREARRRRRHARSVVCCFVDLVVLELAGGTGIEGALFGAAQVSPDWASQWMARALLAARDSGTPSWAALATLGREIGVPELRELSTTLQLAGTEGARVRRSLQARATSLRRHEQAEEESTANAVTERLFLPGALLLVGFLCFIGFPAFTRIVGGF